ncbi:MAG: lytic murein transglycosylase B [Candidatus Rariloculaceae bacterium]
MNGFYRRFCLSLAILAVSGASQAYDFDQDAVDAARAEFIERMVETHDFDRAELVSLLGEAEIVDSILEAISRPAERVAPWHEYREIFLTESRISGGAEFWFEYDEQIRAASTEAGVAPEMLVAILGVETLYGRRTGSYRVLDSLSTLAFAYPPRSTFFTSELEEFLLLVREEGIDPRETLGSYAGAMGAGQFISSSFRAYAVDGNGDGRRDLWGDWSDVFASVANYFKVHGWEQGQSVAARATLAGNARAEEPANSMDLTETVASASQAGYVFATDMPDTAPTTVLSLEGKDGQEYWVGYHNFRVITRYNRSVKYALAAHQLSLEIRAAYEELVAQAGQESGA